MNDEIVKLRRSIANWWIVLALLLFILACTAAYSQTNYDVLVDSISQVESPQGKMGKAGERTTFQFTRAVWKQHSTLPFVQSQQNPVEARRVAIAHCQWLSRNVYSPTPYRIALAWNAGATAANRNSVNRRQADYARRVVNIYEEALHNHDHLQKGKRN